MNQKNRAKKKKFMMKKLVNMSNEQFLLDPKEEDIIRQVKEKKYMLMKISRIRISKQFYWNLK